MPTIRNGAEVACQLTFVPTTCVRECVNHWLPLVQDLLSASQNTKIKM